MGSPERGESSRSENRLRPSERKGAHALLKITRQTDYAVVLLTRFAQEGRGRIHNARDLSGETGVPLPTCSKILKLLARQELLVSQRGVKGGYRLARDPSTITIAQVVAVMEGPVAITECVESAPGDCDKESWCPVRSNWQVINSAVQAALDGVTLERMTRPFESVLSAEPNETQGAALRANHAPSAGGE